MEDRLDVVITVGPLANDVQPNIDLRERSESHILQASVCVKNT
jgi:hypothetical protein